MQRSTTGGRRHSRAGSVSVAELIGKQPSPVRVPRREPAGRGPVADLLREPAHQCAPRPVKPSSRAVGLASGAAALLAFAAVVAVLAVTRSAGPPPRTVEPPAGITGPSALRPDVLSARLGGRAGVPVRAPLPPGPLAADVPVDTPLEAGVTLPPREVAPRSKPQVEVVRHFYRLLPAKPADAVRLLAPDLVGGSAREFVAAWAGVRAITIESTALRPDGAVFAAVSLQEASGRWLRVEQLFELTGASPPRIADVRVLSAQRS